MLIATISIIMMEVLLNNYLEINLIWILFSVLIVSFFFELNSNAFTSWILTFYTVILLVFLLLNSENVFPVYLNKQLFFQDFFNYSQFNFFERDFFDTVYVKHNILNHFLVILFIVFLFVFIFSHLFQMFFSNRNNRSEFLILIFFIMFLGILLQNSYDLLEIFIILETISLTSYILAGFERNTKPSASAGIQYLIIGAIPSIFLGLGIGFFYLENGTVFLQDLEALVSWKHVNSEIIYQNSVDHLLINDFDYEKDSLVTISFSLFILSTKNNKNLKSFFPFIFLISPDLINVDFIFLNILALVFILGTFLYKVKGAPFHLWAPTIYNKVSVSTLVVLMLGLKLIFLFFFLSFFNLIMFDLKDFWSSIFLWTGLFSVLMSIMGAFDQKLLKKFFIYSSIGHVGYLLFSFISNIMWENVRALILYLVIYIITSIILWYTLTIYNKRIDFITNLRKILGNNEYLFGIMIILIFSMSGIPPFAGFYTKFDIFYVLYYSLEVLILFFVLLLTVISFFYYLRILKTIYFDNHKVNIKKYDDLKIESFSWNTFRIYLVYILSFFLVFYFIFMEKGMINIFLFESMNF